VELAFPSVGAHVDVEPGLRARQRMGRQARRLRAAVGDGDAGRPPPPPRRLRAWSPTRAAGAANGWEGKLDVYALRSPTPTPTVIFIHGGGWVQGTKEASALTALPYIAMGYSVVNVEI